MRWRIPVVLTLALFVAVSCDQQPVEPEPATTALFAGADVYHEFLYAHPYFFSWMDNDRAAGDEEDVLLLGYHPADDYTCNDGEYVGGILITDFYVVKDNQQTLGERVQNVGTTIGRPPLYLYIWADYPLGGTWEEECDFLMNGWIAKGSFSGFVKDNDISCFDGTPGVNSYGYKANARLTDREGNKYKWTRNGQMQCNPDWEPPFRTIVDVDKVERK
jgi:hypothetical protein